MRRRSRERFLLCRPHGGLNDTLTLIWFCWGHAQRQERCLVVDAVRSHFCTDFSAVFELLAPIDGLRLAPTPELYRKMNAGSCEPAVLAGRVDAVETIVRPRPGHSPLEWMDVVDVRTGSVLEVDITPPHEATVVVVESYRGTEESIEMLRHLRLTEPMATHVEARLAALPADYVGVHVRNSDIQADVPGFFAALRDQLAGETVLVCSDDGDVLAAAPSFLDRSTVITSSDIPTSGGTPYQLPFIDAEGEAKLTLDALVDLFALAGAKEMHAAPIVNRGGARSGFSLLAMNLGRDRALQHQLLLRTS